eukprot:SAG11_NODE_32800_length_280_cov_10.016575_1_plen_48_part_10
MRNFPKGVKCARLLRRKRVVAILEEGEVLHAAFWHGAVVRQPVTRAAS